MNTKIFKQGAVATVMTFILPAITAGEDAKDAASPSLLVELNRAQDQANGCLLSLYAANQTGVDIKALVLEAVLINTEGQVDRLTLFNLGQLPDGRPRVRQFEISEMACSNLGMMLINGIATCEADDKGICERELRMRSREAIEVAG